MKNQYCAAAMNEQDVKYKLSVTWNKTAKYISADMNTWRDRAIFLPMLSALFMPVLVTDKDDMQTAQSQSVLEEKTQQLETIVAQHNAGEDIQSASQDFISGVFTEEDLSEEQANDFLHAYSRDISSVYAATDLRWGNIGDLRECRAEVGAEDVEKITSCTVEKSSDEDFLLKFTILLALLTMPLSLIGQLPAMRRAAERKPRHAKYKH